MQQPIEKYRSRGLLIDSNLLIPLLVGTWREDMIAHCKRTQTKYTAQDYRKLVCLVRCFDVVATTPNVLTEVSNLATQLNENYRGEPFLVFKALIDKMAEHYLPSAQVASPDAFVRLGLADVTIAQLARDRYLVLTDDKPLHGYLRAQGIEAISFDDVRAYAFRS